MRATSRWLMVLAVILTLTAAGAVTRVNPTTMGFVYLFGVVFLSMWAGLKPGIVASLLATAFYNYFFLPPLRTFHIDDPRNWAAMTAFLLAALVVTRLVLAARAEAAEAERLRLAGEANAHIELLRQSDTFKTSLLRAVSHDLSTPLTAIRIHTASLERHTAGAPELAETVRAIGDETARLHRRIDNLLTIARLESGRFTPHPEPAPPADIFRAVRESLPTVFAERPVTISVDDDCPDAYVDPSLALEILVNLVENAHRASPAHAGIELVARGVRAGGEAMDGGGQAILPVRSPRSERDGQAGLPVPHQVIGEVEGLAAEARDSSPMRGTLDFARDDSGDDTVILSRGDGEGSQTTQDVRSTHFETLRPLRGSGRRDMTRGDRGAEARASSSMRGSLDFARDDTRIARVLLEVRDRGPGIAEDSDVVRRGLGLEIARGLTAASGGTFTLENREGGGAVARVELPAAVLAAETE